MEDYIKYEMVGGGSPRHLNTFSNLFCCCCTLHTSLHLKYCPLLLTVPM